MSTSPAGVEEDPAFASPVPEAGTARVDCVAVGATGLGDDEVPAVDDEVAIGDVVAPVPPLAAGAEPEEGDAVALDCGLVDAPVAVVVVVAVEVAVEAVAPPEGWEAVVVPAAN